MEVSDQLHTPASIPLGWVGPRASLEHNGEKKNPLPLLESVTQFLSYPAGNLVTILTKLSQLKNTRQLLSILFI
jgi:hypothetical protein